MAVNDVYRCEIFQNVGSELTMNVLHVRETVAETLEPIPAQAVAEMIVALYTALAAELSEDWQVTVITARKVSPGSGIPGTLVLGAAEAIVGAKVSEIVPSQAAILFSFYSNTADKTGRGRMYLPGCPESSQNEGQLLETPWDALDTIAQAEFLGEKGPFLGGDGKWRFLVHGGGGSPTSDWDFQSVVTRSNLATQRRRRHHPGFGAV